MFRNKCPTNESLAAFHLGYLPDEVVEAIAAHLEACSKCEVVLHELDDLPADTLKVLKRAAQRTTLEGEHFGQCLNQRPPSETSILGTNDQAWELGEPSPRSSKSKPLAPTLGETVVSDRFKVSAIGDPTGLTSVASSRAGPPPGPTLTPHVLGYEILGELGRGGMGVVYHALEMRLRRPCALKMILAGSHSSTEARSRFLTEAKAVARLRHPNIVQIHHIGESEGLTYLELEYVEGGSLEKALDGTPWPAGAAARLVEALARAIHAMHRLGIVHRDLKPANILLTAEDQPKITDFGLAKALGIESGLTGTESILGTPSYIAPEQAEGHAREAGPSADVYALGVILYELLAGRPPFKGAMLLETLEQVKSADPVPPSRLLPRLPRDLETITLKCLQKDPAKRYDTAEALAEDLERFRQDRPIVARRVTFLEKSWRWGRRNPKVASLSAAILLLVLLVAFGAVAAAIHFERLATQNQQMLVRQYIASGSDRLDEGDLLEAFLWFAKAFLLDDGSPDQEPVHRYRLAATREQMPRLRQLWHHQGGVAMAAFDAEERRVVTVSEDGMARIWDSVTGQPITPLMAHAGPLQCAAFLPDGNTLATAQRDGTVQLWDTANGQPISPPRTLGENVLHVAFSPDGRRLVTASNLWTTRVWDVATGQPSTPELKSSHWLVPHAAFSPDGRLVVASTGQGALVWDATTGQRCRTNFPIRTW